MHSLRPHHTRRIAGVLSLLIALLALGGCGRAPGEQGALFSDPGQALLAALGPGGWLGPMERVSLHALADAPESRVALYSARRADGGGWFVGVADAKRDWGRWFAHGRIGALSPPALAGELSCIQMTVPAGGAEWQVLVGRLDPTRVAAVELVDTEGAALPAALRDDMFTAMARLPGEARTIRALDAAGGLVAELPVADCVAP